MWCNPPYGDEAKPWVERMAVHNNGVLLIFARTETQTFRRVWETAHSILFLYKRISFLLPSGKEKSGGMAPSVLAAFGDNNTEILKRAKESGSLQGAHVRYWT